MRIALHEKYLHHTPTGLLWATGLYEHKHEVYLSQEIKGEPNEFPTDLDLLIYFNLPNDVEKIYRLKLYKEKNPNVKIVGVGGPPQSNYADYKGVVDFFCGIAYRWNHAKNKFNELGFDYYDIPMAGNPRKFFPIDPAPKKKYDISFIGTFGERGHGDRDQQYYLFPALKDQNLKWFGAGFEWEGKYLDPVHPDDLNNVYNMTKVNLNFHYSQEKEEKPENEYSRVDLNARIFDIALSGNFQLCDHPLVGELFDFNIVISSKEDWLKTIYYYKDNPGEREKLSKNAREIALKNHTWEKRMGTFLDILKDRG